MDTVHGRVGVSGAGWSWRVAHRAVVGGGDGSRGRSRSSTGGGGLRVAVPHTARRGRGGARVCSASTGFQAEGNNNRRQLTPNRSGPVPHPDVTPLCACVRAVCAWGGGWRRSAIPRPQP